MQTNININVADLTLNNSLVFEHENTRFIITKQDANHPNPIPFEEYKNPSSIWDMVSFLFVVVAIILLMGILG